MDKIYDFFYGDQIKKYAILLVVFFASHIIVLSAFMTESMYEYILLFLGMALILIVPFSILYTKISYYVKNGFRSRKNKTVPAYNIRVGFFRETVFSLFNIIIPLIFLFSILIFFLVKVSFKFPEPHIDLGKKYTIDQKNLVSKLLFEESSIHTQLEKIFPWSFPVPASAKSIVSDDGARIIIYQDEMRMPDLSGLSMKEAIYIMFNLGLTCKVKGSGILNNQFPKPKTSISPNDICKLTFSQIHFKETEPLN